MELDDWRRMKAVLGNYLRGRFTPAHLPHGHPTRRVVRDMMRATADAFLSEAAPASAPRVRCQLFRDWDAAEEHHARRLRLLARRFADQQCRRYRTMNQIRHFATILMRRNVRNVETQRHLTGNRSVSRINGSTAASAECTRYTILTGTRLPAVRWPSGSNLLKDLCRVRFNQCSARR